MWKSVLAIIPGLGESHRLPRPAHKVPGASEIWTSPAVKLKSFHNILIPQILLRVGSFSPLLFFIIISRLQLVLYIYNMGVPSSNLHVVLFNVTKTL